MGTGEFLSQSAARTRFLALISDGKPISVELALRELIQKVELDEFCEATQTALADVIAFIQGRALLRSETELRFLEYFGISAPDLPEALRAHNPPEANP